MKKLIDYTTNHLDRGIDQITEITNMLEEAIHNPYFKGNTASARERLQELNVFSEDLEWIKNYLKNMKFDF